MRKKIAATLLALAAVAAVAAPANADTTTASVAKTSPGAMPMWKCGGGC
jgi:hypothetical protein